MLAFKKDKNWTSTIDHILFLANKRKNLTNIKIDDSKISEISRPWKDIHIFCLIVLATKINWPRFYVILRNDILFIVSYKLQVLKVIRNNKEILKYNLWYTKSI